MQILNDTYLHSLNTSDMNKDIKTILILWIISIIISAIWLYQFKDIKFKNTKKLQQAQIEKQQEIINDYNDLVDVYIPNITDSLPANDLPTTWTITLLIPWYFENQWLYTLADKLKQEEISLYIEKIDSYSKYQETINNNLTNYDIALIPTNRINWLQLQEINLGENIKPYFINIFSPLLDKKNIIPYSLDPAITLYNGIEPQTNRKDIFSYALLRKETKKYAIPIMWWFDEMTQKLLENGITPFENYTELLVLQLKQIKDIWDNQELSSMLNTNNISSKNKYTYINLKQLLNILVKQNKFCEEYPAICIVRYWYSDIKFWFMSDFDIIDAYFSKNNSLYAGNFTNSTNSYPTKWRVFVVPNWNKNTNLTNKFFSEYISQSIDWDTTFRNHTLSAITNIYDQQRQNEFFENILSNENKFYLFINSIDLQNQITTDWKTFETLNWKYSISAYIKNFNY